METAQVDSGDAEHVSLEAIARAQGDYVASVRATTEDSTRDDGKLRVRGGDTIRVTYADTNTLEGEAGVKRLASVRLVTASTLRTIWCSIIDTSHTPTHSILFIRYYFVSRIVYFQMRGWHLSLKNSL